MVTKFKKIILALLIISLFICFMVSPKAYALSLEDLQSAADSFEGKRRKFSN